MTIASSNTRLELNQGNTSFKGALTPALNGLNWMKNNPAMGACGVDIASMVIPRTIVELNDRGKQSGIETFIREISSAFMHSITGLIGFGAACAISGKFNRENGVKAQNIFASGEAIKNISEIWINSKEDNSKFFEKFVKNLKGLNGCEWKSISNHEEITQGLIEIANKHEKLKKASGNEKSNLLKEIKNLKSVLIAKITKDTGAKTSFKLIPVSSNAKEISLGISELIDSAVSLSDAFKNKKTPLDSFVKGLMKNKSASTILGLGITASICMSVQPINNILTKKRTGNEGFVGVNTKEKDNSLEFKILKAISSVMFPVFAISTIGCKPKDLLSNVQFNGKIPTLNQFKLIYGSTITSRLIASRDKNELREGIIKDTLGFSTWLLFGDFVSKLISRKIVGKELINNPIEQEGKKGIGYAKDWLMKTTVKSFDEILMPKAKEIIKDGKVLTLKELYKNADDKIKTQVKKAAFAQSVGYLFSGIVLGAGITKFNILVTKYVNADKQNHNIHDKTHSNKMKLSPIFNEFNKF